MAKETVTQKLIQLVDLAQSILNEFGKPPNTTSCLRCEAYDEFGYCQKWKSTVPDNAIEDGCPEFYDRIPF